MTKVSIIIPAWNEAAGIAHAIERAWQTGPHEVLVVDGGSDDGTAVVAGACPCVVFQASRGRARQQNLGASHAVGDVLLFLHADTWLDEDGISQIQRAMKAPSVVGGAFVQHIEAVGCLYRMLERGNARRVRRRGTAYGDQGIFLRRELFERLGGFPDVPLLEDLLLMKAVQSARPAHEVTLLPGPLHVSARRWQRHGVIRQTIRNRLILVAHALGFRRSGWRSGTRRMGDDRSGSFGM